MDEFFKRLEKYKGKFTEVDAPKIEISKEEEKRMREYDKGLEKARNVKGTNIRFRTNG